jgi:hypothetical protein
VEDNWRLVVVLAAAAVVGVWLLVARALRKRRLAALEPFAKELGVFFHGGTFRGHVEGHAVRGDGEGEIPRLEPSRRGSILGLFTAGRRSVRVRVELSAPDAPSPDATKAAAAARKDLKDRGTDAALFEVALLGTELVFVLRGDAATPETAARLVRKALEAATAG